ncbi:unnamed protein product [Mytilus edulis]|uniref:Uncharacterized protein n=1 Tax=Mytilus edulis TaxID=6550 RepID=A0A8S3VLF1_MYTED|nr:unnamed protein product [Mytilus edulis]
MKICPGNNDFSDICRYRYPNTLAEFGNTEYILLASKESLAHETTIRTVAYGMLCDSPQERCSNCQVFWPNLLIQRSRTKTKTETKLTHRLDYMTTGQLKERVLHLKNGQSKRIVIYILGKVRSKIGRWNFRVFFEWKAYKMVTNRNTGGRRYPWNGLVASSNEDEEEIAIDRTVFADYVTEYWSFMKPKVIERFCMDTGNAMTFS